LYLGDQQMAKSGMLFQKIFQYNGTIITIIPSNPNNAGEFFAINNRGIFGSTDLVFLEQ
jgi:hypothetical protein